MMIGACLWLLGEQLGLFNHVFAFVGKYGLAEMLVLAGLIISGVYVAAIRKSRLLRNALKAELAAEAQAKVAARRDPLTGLPNRRDFIETCQMRLQTRSSADQFAVMMIDLDRFKPINDGYGHAAGDEVLRAVSARLTELAPPASVVARLGGDEFVVLVPFDGEQKVLADLALRLINAVQLPVLWNNSHVDVDATIGIAVATPGEENAEAVLHAADLAMYEGKRDGRGTFRFFKSEMERKLKIRTQLAADLKNAISSGEITPYFQPIVKLPSRELVAYEVLARWDHPTLGLVMPDVFIPIALDTGMICSLFYQILDRATSDARSWPPHLRLSVNVAPQQLRDPWLAERVLAVLTKNDFPPGRLEVEITESSLISDLEAARALLTSLQNLGIKIALDDFGTGYSSLYHLRELRFNKIKIDKSYISALAEGTDGAKLVDAIIQLGSNLSIETTAEGVETSSDLDWLSGQGCTFGQGYLFGRPMPRESIEKLLNARPEAEPGEESREASQAA
ncbi:MAG TPA: EAL domain-containing protein [Methylocystis sp.]|nr:EAL domain-containing protein [Methylocystis sp.]